MHPDTPRPGSSNTNLNELLQLALNSTTDYAIITLDASGIITTWNQGAEILFGYPAQEAIGQPVDLTYLPQDRANGVPQNEIRRARAYGRSAEERWLQHKGGTRLYCSGVTTPLGHDPTLGFVKITRDYTVAKRVERLHEAMLRHERWVRKRAQMANQLKDEYLAVMSHELKHPLNLIYVNAELLAHLPEVRNSPMASKSIATIQRSVMNQVKIIDDLLDLSRIHTGKLTLNRTRLDAVDVVRNVVENARNDIDQAGLELVLNAEEAPLVLDGDEVRLEQIVWNLLSNSIKFTPRGGRITVNVLRDGPRVRIDVIDTGRGIDHRLLPKIFEMFGQADTHTTRREGGLGVGLALVRQLTQLHGGQVKACSEGIDKGSRFTVWLPLVAESENAVASPRPEVSRPNQGRLCGLRVLLVDDAVDTLEAFGYLLELEGAKVTLARSGIEALEQAHNQHFDLILSDVSMPNMDGHELLARLHHECGMRDVPAIALTGFARAQDIRRALAAGFKAHLGKPVTLDALLTLLERLGVRRREPPRASGTEGNHATRA